MKLTANTPSTKDSLRTGILITGGFVAAVLLAACGGGGDGSANNAPPASPSSTSVHLQRVPNASTTFAFPVLVTAPPGDLVRLFVVEKGGTIKVVNKTTNTVIGTFLDISGLVTGGSEQGLLGLAFDPAYTANGRFYVSYTDKTGVGNSVIARYVVSSGDANVADPTSGQTVLTLTQPDTNHNGGMIAFGPDNMLYIGFGDGGGAGDPGGNGQSKNVLLGKILRIDVSTLPYAIPADNPFTSAPQRKEIWSYGLRNPWRFSFDRQTHDLYIADVGQGIWEEVDIATAASGGGKGINYGWNVMEGNHCFSPSANCVTTGLTAPDLEYDHASNSACSITGGYVYRGSAIPALRGTYFYGDFCAGFVRSLSLVNGVATQLFDWPSLRPGGNITSFGEDGAGELYVMTSGGTLYRIVPD